ncbi:MAG TPA: putative porin [bacterium]|jgi:hypothetical protein
MDRKHTLAIFALLALALPSLLFAEETKSWTDKIKLSGDFRYRYEFIGAEAYNSATASKIRIYDRNRNRIRVRLGLQAIVNPDIDAYFRLATSTGTSNTSNPVAGDPVSTNQDLSGGFTPKPIWVDRAYVDFHPGRAKWFDGRAGRQPVPFETNGDELVYDNDLNVEGASLLLNHKLGAHELFFRAGGYWAGERAPSSTTKHALTQGLFEAQLGGKLAVNTVAAQLAVAYIDYGNVKGNPTLYAPNNGFGNSLVPISGRGTDTLGYKFDYNLINVNGMAKIKLDKIEPGVLFDFVTNSDVKKDTSAAYNKKLNMGWLAGAFVKFKGMPIDWDFSYDYRVLQKDATIGAFSFSDPAGGGTNFNGHKISLGFNTMANTRLAATYFRNVKDPDNTGSARHLNYDRIQADLEVKF